MSHPATTTARPRANRSVPRLLRLGALLMVVAWLAVAGLGGSSMGKLSGLQKNDSTAFLPASAEATMAAEQAKAFADKRTLPAFVVVVRDGGLTPADKAAAQAFIAGLPALQVGSTTMGELLASTPRAFVPSENGKALLLPIQLDADKSKQQIDGKSAPGVVAKALDAALQEKVAVDGAQAWVTGPVGYASAFAAAFAGIDGVLLLVALGVVLVILVAVYRSPLLPIVVLLSAVFGLSAAGGIVYLLAKAGTIDVSGQSQGILSILVVGAATDYALLLVARFREELTRHEGAWDAMKATWRGTVEPIVASGLTVILGLLCLLFASLSGTRSLGPISALGIVGALLAALTFLPAVLLLLGRKVFWPRIPRVGEHPLSEGGLPEGVWGRLAGWVGRHPRRVWMTTAVALALLALLAPTFRSSGLSLPDTFRVEVPAVTGERKLAEHFPAGSATPVQVVVPQVDADAVIAAIKGLPGVVDAAVAAPAGPPGTPPKVVDGRVIVNATLADDATSRAGQDAVKAMRDKLHPTWPDLKIGGQAATVLDTRLHNERDVKVVLPAILGVVFLVLAFLLRSLVAPLLLVAVNVLSFLATLGVSAFLFNHVFGFANSDPSTPLYAFVFLIALGIDYSIFLMTRAREEVPERGTRAAVLVALAVTGGVITSAGIVLAATFASLFLLPLVFMAQLAFFVAFGVLLDTFVVRTLLVPGLVHELGDRTWWPSKLSRRAKDTVEPVAADA